MDNDTITSANLISNRPAPLLVENLRNFCQADPERNEMIKICRFEFLWIKTGSLVLNADLGQHTLYEGTFCYLKPGQLRAFQYMSNDISGYLISMSPEFITIADSRNELAVFPLYTGGFSYGVLEMDEEIENEVEDVILKLSKVVSTKTSSSAILEAYFRVLILHISKITAGATTVKIKSRESEIVESFMSLLQKHFITKKMVSEYAQDLFVSPNYLNRVVKKISGFPASYHIQQYLVLEAKRQAVLRGSSMKEIAYFLGFNDYAHFSKFFKNNSGVNFSNFKKGLSVA